MQNNDYIAELIYLQLTSKGLTEVQKQELQTWLEKSPHNQEMLDILFDDEWMHKHLELFSGINSEAGLLHVQKLIAADGQQGSIPFRGRWRWWRYVAAAVMVGVVGLIGYYIRFDKPSSEVVSINRIDNQLDNDVMPGSYKATLKLDDGRLILLDSISKGLLVTEGNTNIYSKDGHITYDIQNKANNALYNILETAAGQTYTLTLSDGTKVWLNAKSSLRFPVSFSGSERNVEMSGEAYFEIAKDPTKKFLVSVKGVTTEVLGTHFNINAYEDENNTAVTLLEGSVKIKSTTNSILQSVTIEPGQQAQVKLKAGDGKIHVLKDVDPDEVIAWKEGAFVFKGESISTIMRQIARWYDVSIEFIAQEPAGKYSGMISRNTKLSEVLSMLEQSNIRFKVEKKKLIVLP